MTTVCVVEVSGSDRPGRLGGVRQLALAISGLPGCALRGSALAGWALSTSIEKQVQLLVWSLGHWPDGGDRCRGQDLGLGVADLGGKGLVVLAADLANPLDARRAAGALRPWRRRPDRVPPPPPTSEPSIRPSPPQGDRRSNRGRRPGTSPGSAARAGPGQRLRHRCPSARPAAGLHGRSGRSCASQLALGRPGLSASSSRPRLPPT